MAHFFTYILYSKSWNRYYIGSTNNLTRRLTEHNSGQTKSTRNGKPWRLAFLKIFKTYSQARNFEIKIKRMKSRKFIEDLIDSKENEATSFKEHIFNSKQSG